MNIAEIGVKLGELGALLKHKREEREALSKEIGVLEGEAKVLLTEHGKLLAELFGPPETEEAQAVESPPGPHINGLLLPGHNPRVNGKGKRIEADPIDIVKRKVLKYLKQADPGTSALDIAEALALNAEQVRQVMRELAMQRTPTP